MTTTIKHNGNVKEVEEWHLIEQGYHLKKKTLIMTKKKS